MADPVVHITNGIPDSGTGNITTLGSVVAALPAALGAGGGLKVDGSGTALPVSAASLPLPTGAATAANQTAIQAASGAAVPANVAMAGLSDGTNAQRWITANALTDGVNGNNTGCVMPYVYNGATFDRLRGTAADGLKAQISGGGNIAAVKAANIAPLAGDPALVVAISPNSVAAPRTTSGAMSAGFALVGLPTDQLKPNLLQTQSSGATATRVVAGATTNATSLKGSAGNISNIDVFNVAAYTVFLKLYDKATAPTVGTDTPVWTIPIAAGAGYSRHFNNGRHFGTGIAYAITKLQADADTTALVAGDVTGSIEWI